MSKYRMTAPELPVGVLPRPGSPNPFKYHFFISYTTREPEVRQILPVIDEFREHLIRWGYTHHPFFLDRLEWGRSYRGPDLRTDLNKAVSESVCMFAFLSPGYDDSEWCHFEWREMQKFEMGQCWLIGPILWKSPAKGFEPPPREQLDITDYTQRRFSILRRIKDHYEFWSKTIADAAQFINRSYACRTEPPQPAS